MNHLDNQKQTIRFITDEIYTTEVAHVVSFDKLTCSASVSLAVKREFADGTEESAPLFLYNVPVRYAQMGNFTLYAPLTQDDSVYLHFARTDWDKWLLSPDNSVVVSPDGTDKHTRNCPYIEVGARNLANPAHHGKFMDKAHMSQGATQAQYITMADDGIVINAGATTVTISNAGGITISPNGDVTIDSGNVLVPNGDVIASGISLLQHDHGYIDSVGTAATPTPRVTGSAVTSPLP